MKTNKSEVLLAFDKSNVRRTDTDGRLFLETSRISKAGVNPYWGREIPKYDELGLDPDKVYQVSRLSSHAWPAGLRSNVFASLCTTRPILLQANLRGVAYTFVLSHAFRNCSHRSPVLHAVFRCNIEAKKPAKTTKNGLKPNAKESSVRS